LNVLDEALFNRHELLVGFNDDVPETASLFRFLVQGKEGSYSDKPARYNYRDLSFMFPNDWEISCLKSNEEKYCFLALVEAYQIFERKYRLRLQGGRINQTSKKQIQYLRYLLFV
jgi:hypothetical protein